MDESLLALDQAAKSGTAEQQIVLERVLGCPATYRLWEAQHLRLLSKIASQFHRARQAATALSASFSLVYAKSLFEYLRESGARKSRRRQLVAHFHGENGYVQSLIAEHGKYLRNTASLICIKHVGRQVLEHKAFGEPIEAYERTYAEYFRTYCQWVVPDRLDNDTEILNALQSELKVGVLAARQRLMEMPISPAARH